MFFRFDEKTLKDAIDNQKKREEAVKAEESFEYDGHKLKFLKGRDGSVIIDAEPSLIKEVEGDKNVPCDPVDAYTGSGWAPRQ